MDQEEKLRRQQSRVLGDRHRGREWMCVNSGEIDSTNHRIQTESNQTPITLPESMAYISNHLTKLIYKIFLF